MILLRLPFKIDVGKRKKIWVQLAPSMNIQIREHFQKKIKRKDEIKRLINEAITIPEKPLKEVHIVYRRGSISLLDPIDNFGASFKAIGDCIVELGIISDDATDCIRSFEPIAHKVSKIADQYIEVEIHEKDSK